MGSTEPSWVKEIWSGGQTGVDRAALDVAIILGIPHGGWVPVGRLAEDGTIPAWYFGLRETPSADCEERTEQNVRDSDATLIVHFGPLSGGTQHTRDCAMSLGKPLLQIDGDALDTRTAASTVRSWLAGFRGGIRLNVAGPRASTEPRAYEWTHALLVSFLDEPGEL